MVDNGRRSDYLKMVATEAKREGRAALLVEAAASAARSMQNCLAARNSDLKVSSRIDDTRARELIVDYFERVVDFKIEHRYRPDARIGPPKIVALLIETIYSRSCSCLFHIDSSRIELQAIARSLFARRLVFSILGLDVSFEDHEVCRDIHAILTNESMRDVNIISVLFNAIYIGRNGAGSEED